MKTAEELFNEHTTFSYLDTDDKVFKIVALTQFIKALTEHDNEIKQLIDEMKGNPDGMELTKEEYNIYLCGYDDGLTELKSKI